MNAQDWINESDHDFTPEEVEELALLIDTNAAANGLYGHQRARFDELLARLDNRH